MAGDLVLDVRLDGFEKPVGTLVRDGRNALSFTYDAAYAGQAEAVPLSLSMPLTDEPHGDAVARAFFDNLLQERDGALTTVMAREGIARDDVAGLLLHLGKDCAGALSALPQGAPPIKVPGDFVRDYVELSDERLSAIVTALHERRRLPEGTADPSPLAGVQSKIALAVLPSGSFAEPRPGSGAPTTHILKVPGRDNLQDVALEAEAMALHRSLGFRTARVDGGQENGIPVLLVTRFDRYLDAQGRVARRHQEDFAQALGLPAELKYERRGILPDRRFDAAAIGRVLAATSDPASARSAFLHAMLFDLLIGNTDGHAKNHALLHGGRGQTILAPRYDILPTRLDPGLTDELAFRIGSATRLEEITREDFDVFLSGIGVDTGAAQRRLRLQPAQFLANQLSRKLAGLDARGMKPFADLIASNIRTLLPVLGGTAPETASARDAFVQRAGGWLLGS